MSLNTISLAQSTNPGLIFPITTNTMLPSKYWLDNKKPYPTNAWFINFALEHTAKGVSEPVNIFPYLARISPKGISLSYTAAVNYAEPNHPGIISALYYQFDDQLTLGTREELPLYGIKAYQGLSLTLEWQNAQKQKITAPILQGSPYLTEFFTNASPQLSTRFKWLSINQQTQRGVLAQSSRHELILTLDSNNTQTWLLYSENPISFIWTTTPKGDQLIANETYSGWVRIVLQQDTKSRLKNDVSVLDAFSQTIPLGYQQNYYSTSDQIEYAFRWKTQNNKPPLMLSLPHQRNITPQNPLISYSGIKGLMVGETSATQTIVLPKIPIQFLENKQPSSLQKKQLRDALNKDANNFMTQPFPDDGPYRTGKRYARTARLILIADRLGEYSLQKQMLNFIEKLLYKKMQDKSAWHFQYDTTWGGIIPSIDDYGARHYNDHHFHYGYWVYTFAIIAKYDPEWLNRPLPSSSYSPGQWIEGLIRDYANPDKDDRWFPLQRQQDDYAGHSWASGLEANTDGQNQQSSSEAVNAYYAIALYAQALGDNPLLAWAEFLMTREIRAAQTYWQIQKNNIIYNEDFKKNNQVIGNLWSSKVDANAFFVKCDATYRCGLEYSFGIQMLPFTAISEQLLNKEWLNNAAPMIKKLISHRYGKITPAWRWYLIKGMTPIMTKNEKNDFFQRAVQSKPQDYDNGDSKTNTLYFLMDD